MPSHQHAFLTSVALELLACVIFGYTQESPYQRASYEYILRPFNLPKLANLQALMPPAKMKTKI